MLGFLLSRLHLLLSMSFLLIYNWGKVFPRRDATWLKGSLMTDIQSQLFLHCFWFFNVGIEKGLSVRCEQLLFRVSNLKSLLMMVLFDLLLLFFSFRRWAFNIPVLLILQKVNFGLRANQNVRALGNHLSWGISKILLLLCWIVIAYVLIRRFNAKWRMQYTVWLREAGL
jgi:hypothetical protein